MIETIIDRDETILWQDKPSKWLYAFGSFGFYIFALIWACFDGFMLYMFMQAGSFTSETGVPFGSSFAFIAFFIIHMTPVWIAIIAPIFRLIAWKNIEYALTDRRIYMVSGLFGKDIISLELRDIQHLTVNVNPFENMCQRGTIRLTPDVSTNRRNSSSTTRGYRLYSIANPYEVYNQIKRVALDVTTDQQYPNQYRPSENPGYHTKYRK